MKIPHTIREIELSNVTHALIPRESPPKDIPQLAESMNKVNQLQPVLLTPDPSQEGCYLSVTGERRIAAARLICWETIKAVVLEGADAAKLAVIAVADNTARQNLSLFDCVQQASL